MQFLLSFFGKHVFISVFSLSVFLLISETMFANCFCIIFFLSKIEAMSYQLLAIANVKPVLQSYLRYFKFCFCHTKLLVLRKINVDLLLKQDLLSK